MGVAQWSGEAWGAALTGAAAAGAAGAQFCRYLLAKDKSFQQHERGWVRAAELEEEARLLRIALHKATQRGNAGWTGLEMSLLAMPLPLEDRLRVIRQIREIVERSLGDGR